MRAAERGERADEILRLFAGGASCRQVAAEVGCSVQTVYRAVALRLEAGTKRRELLSDELPDSSAERFDRLLLAFWDKALAGDYRAAEVCRRMLSQRAKLIDEDVVASPVSLPAPAASVEGRKVTDELASLRDARSAG